jgi:hypothetical protein
LFLDKENLMSKTQQKHFLPIPTGPVPPGSVVYRLLQFLARSVAEQFSDESRGRADFITYGQERRSVSVAEPAHEVAEEQRQVDPRISSSPDLQDSFDKS